MNSLKNVFPSAVDAFPRPSQVRGRPLTDDNIRPLSGSVPLQAMQRLKTELAESPIVARHATGTERMPPANVDLEQLLAEARLMGQSSFLKLARPRYGLTPGQREWVMERAFPDAKLPVVAGQPPADEQYASDESDAEMVRGDLQAVVADIRKRGLSMDAFKEIAESEYSLSEDDSDAVVAMAFPAGGAGDRVLSDDEAQSQDADFDRLERAQEILEKWSAPSFIQLSAETDIEDLVREHARRTELPPPPAGEGAAEQISRIGGLIKALSSFNEREFYLYADASLPPAESSWVRDWLAGPVQRPADAQFEYVDSSDGESEEERVWVTEGDYAPRRRTNLQGEQREQLLRAESFHSQGSRASVLS